MKWQKVGAGLLVALLLSLFGCVESLDKINSVVNVANKVFHPKNYTRELVERAATGAFDHVVGRDDLFRLLRRQIQQEQNTLITGLTGVGKTQLVNQLAREIARGRAGALNGMKVFAFDLDRLKDLFLGRGMVTPETLLLILDHAIDTLVREQGEQVVFLFDEIQKMASLSEFTLVIIGGETIKFTGFLKGFMQLVKKHGRLIFITTEIERVQSFGNLADMRVLELHIQIPAATTLARIGRATADVLRKEHGVGFTGDLIERVVVPMVVLNVFHASAPSAVAKAMRDAAVRAKNSGRMVVSEQDISDSLSTELGLRTWELIRPDDMDKTVEQHNSDVAAEINTVIDDRNVLTSRLLRGEFTRFEEYEEEIEQQRDRVRDRFGFGSVNPDVRERRLHRCHLKREAASDPTKEWKEFCATKERGKDKQTCEQAFNVAKDVVPCSWDAKAKTCGINAKAKEWNDPCNLLPPPGCDQDETRDLCVLEPALAAAESGSR